MSYRFINVKRYKQRQPTWTDGHPRSCTGCRTARRRSRQVIVTADMIRSGSRFKYPVAYCADHNPITEKRPI